MCDYFEGRLPRDVIEEIDQHLSLCKNCLIYLRTYRKSVELIHMAPAIEMPEELKAILKKALQ